MKLTTIGIDMAKNVFRVHGADEIGKEVMKKQLKRTQVLLFFADLTPCHIGMEACGSAHYWARKLQARGHTVQLIPPQKAKEWGIVHEVFDDTGIKDGALVLARRLAEGPTRALAATRQLLEESDGSTYADQFRRGLEVQTEIRASADTLEGRAAFVEKRPACFTGR